VIRCYTIVYKIYNVYIMIFKTIFSRTKNGLYSTNIIIPFFVVHAFFLLLPLYLYSFGHPSESFFASVFAIYVYSIFYFILFQKSFLSALVSAGVSVIMGLLFGSYILDHIYPHDILLNYWHRAYIILLVYYIYLFIDMVRHVFSASADSPSIVFSNKKTQKIIVRASVLLACFFIMVFILSVIDMDGHIYKFFSHDYYYRNNDMGFSMTVDALPKPHKTKVNIVTHDILGKLGEDTILYADTINFLWSAEQTRWNESYFKAFILRRVSIALLDHAISIADDGTVSLTGQGDEWHNFLGMYMGRDTDYFFILNVSPECPSIMLYNEIKDSDLCGLVHDPFSSRIKDFTLLYAR